MKALLKACRWIVGIILILSCIGGFANGDILPAILVLLIGFFVLPLSTKKSQPAATAQPGKPETKRILMNHKETPPPDASIIDVNAADFNVQIQNRSLLKYTKGVPVWNHRYVYTHEELKSATVEQKNFYTYFKYCFLKGQYLDVEGNSNYYFILLFDLLNDYKTHKKILQLEQQLEELGTYYPKTKSYGISFLLEIVEKLGDTALYSRIKDKQYPATRYSGSSTYSFSEDYWSLGAKYKAKLNLTKAETEVLNKIYYSGNNFWDIEFCRIEVIRIFLKLVSALREAYSPENTSFDQQIDFVTDLVARKHFKYRAGTNNYKYALESIKRELTCTVMKLCENALREHYGHKRKLAADMYLHIPEIKEAFDQRILGKVNSQLEVLVNTAPPPDKATELELNSQNVNRWKIPFEQICEKIKMDNPDDFKDAVINLAALNKKNPSVEMIFFEASKIIAKTDKQLALEMYIRYIHTDLKSSSFDNRQMTKTVQKSLFKDAQQVETFEAIIDQLIRDKNLDAALKATSGFYATKRKRITLNTSSISAVQSKHSETVELLNTYLQDEPEAEKKILYDSTDPVEEIVLHLQQEASQQPAASRYAPDVTLSSVQVTTLDYFAKRSFTVPQSELEIFARSNNAFKSQLVDSINDACYEMLDDVLIEEEDESYIINPDYYKRIQAQ